MDFNTLNIGERDYTEQPILINVVDLFFNECEILLTTDNMDVLGRNDFGFKSSDIIWKTNSSEQQIQSEITNEIQRNCFSNEFLEDWKVEVKFMQGSDKDIALIDITAKPVEGSETRKSFIFN